MPAPSHGPHTVTDRIQPRPADQYGAGHLGVALLQYAAELMPDDRHTAQLPGQYPVGRRRSYVKLYM